MAVEKIIITMFLSILLASCFVTTLGIDFLDTETLIVRQRPNDRGALFGYSAVLHSVDPSGGMDNMRLMVGAPLQIQPSNNGSMQPTGAIYSCNLTEDECTVLNQPSFYTFNDSTFERNSNNNQLLGISLHSTGNSFVACAPRLRAGLTENQAGNQENEFMDIEDFGGFFSPPIAAYENMPGRCFIGDRSLQIFTENEYCYRDNAGNDQLRQCNIGISMTGSTPESGDNTFVFGMPTSLNDANHGGSFLFTITNGSNIVREHQSRGGRYSFPETDPCSELRNSGHYAYDGFTVAVGHITSTTNLDIITAQPRYQVEYAGNIPNASLPEIRGLVRVASDFVTLSNCQRYNYTSHLYGNTPIEYFGWSLVALDLTGDGYDELLVGAPLHSYVAGALNCLDCGRMYVYRNNATRNLEYEKDLLGTVPFGRFSYAMTSVGDINYDGCDDFVVSTPLSRAGSESGTIYLYLGAGPSVLVSNEYTQRIVGSELNGLASVVSFGSSLSSGYDIDGNRYNDLVVGAGFNETVVVLRTRPIFQVYTNMTASSLSVSFTSPNCVLSGAQNGTLDGICFNVTFVIRDTRKNITADYELAYTLTADAGVQPPLLFVNSSSQENVLNDTVTFSPSVSVHTITKTVYTRPSDSLVSRNSLITLNVMVNDNSGAVVPETLMPTVLSDPTSITNLTVFLNGSTGCFASSSCQNDLYLRTNVETRPRGPQQSNNSIILADVTRTIIVSVFFTNVENASCVQTYVNYPNVLNRRRVTRQSQVVECVDRLCFTNIPGDNEDNEVRMDFEFEVRSYPDDISITFNASSGCSEVNETNNLVTVDLLVRRVADLTTSIMVSPDQQSFLPISDESDSMVDLSDALGSEPFRVTVNVRNTGPSNSRFATLMIYWPFMDPDETDQFFLYPTRITTSPNVTCGMEHIDPLNLTTTRRKRQSGSNTPELVPTETWDCSGNQREECTLIQCNITDLAVSESTPITITSRPDLRTLSRRGSASQWELVVFAMVVSDDQGDDDTARNDAMGTALINPIPVETPPSDDGDDGIPIWIIIIAIVAAILFIIVIGIILYCCGFCRRKKHDEEADEEAQKWVSASGTVTPDLSRENSMRTRTLTDENKTSNINDYYTDEDVNKKEDSIPPEGSDEKEAPPEYTEENVPPESKEESVPTESDEKNAPPEESTPPDTNIGSDNGIPLETIGTGEGKNDSTTVELTCEETDL